MQKNIAIKLKNVSKKYILRHDKPTFVESVINQRREEFNALKNINITVKNGERVGIIGSNGSGKTTLLKILAEITSPTSGAIERKGKLVSLIDLEAGFHPDLSGYQNIFLSGLILGMSKLEIKNKLKEIIKFADIGKFINSPLFTYSKGMKLRLGFATAISTDPDILVLDENISVGDEEFSRVSFKKIKDMFKKKKTIIIASHDLDLISKYCKRVIWLKNGVIFKDGETKKVIKNYLRFVYSQEL